MEGEKERREENINLLGQHFFRCCSFLSQVCILFTVNRLICNLHCFKKSEDDIIICMNENGNF